MFGCVEEEEAEEAGEWGLDRGSGCFSRIFSIWVKDQRFMSV